MTGSKRAVIMTVANEVLSKGPGDGIIDSENMPRMIRIRYCPS